MALNSMTIFAQFSMVMAPFHVSLFGSFYVSGTPCSPCRRVTSISSKFWGDLDSVHYARALDNAELRQPLQVTGVDDSGVDARQTLLSPLLLRFCVFTVHDQLSSTRCSAVNDALRRPLRNDLGPRRPLDLVWGHAHV